MAKVSKDNPYGLTAKQQLFCKNYIKNYNATHSYFCVYDCAYSTANYNGPNLLVNTRIKKEIKRLQKLTKSDILVDPKKIVMKMVKIAFSDIGDYVEFDKNMALVKSSETVDTSLISEISQTKEGIKLKLIDQKWALNFLIRYFGLDPDSTHQKRYLDKRIELEEKKIDSDKNIEDMKETIKNFLDSTKPNENEVNNCFRDKENETD